jgi:hypothetical protein
MAFSIKRNKPFIHQISNQKKQELHLLKIT